MAKWTATKSNWTPTLVNDTTAFTDGGYMALQGGSTTQVIYVSEIYIGGLAISQAPMALVVSLDSTVGVTALTGVNNNPVDRATAALAAPPLAFSASTTKPQRSATLQLLTPAVNAFGGITKMSALDPSHRISLLGNVANAGELSLSAINTGTVGAISSHWVYEPL